MKDKTARALAIVALVFMAIFVVTLIMTLVDHTMLHGSIGYVALCSGVFTLMIFIALKADGRGYSITKMNNEIEMQKIEKELEEKEKAEQAAKANAENSDTENAENADSVASDKDPNGKDETAVKQETADGEESENA